MNQFAFKKGIDQVPKGKVNQVKQEISDALKIKNRVSLSRRMHGKIEPKISEVEAIEKVFAKYGIKQVWGE